MPAEIDPFLVDLAVVMIVASLVTVVFHKLKQPVVIGYLIAGMIVGINSPLKNLPKTEIANVTLPYFVQHMSTINILASLGIILLMFTIGLEFSFKKLRRIGPTAIVAGSFEIFFMLMLGIYLGHLIGWNDIDSIFLGAALSIGSTTIILKILTESGKIKESEGRIILGILIVEDFAIVILLTLLSSEAFTRGFSYSEIEFIGRTIVNISLFVIFSLVIGIAVVPRIIDYISTFRNDEVLIVSSLGLCFGMSLLSLYLGLSVAVGAFIMGVIIAESRYSRRIVERMSSIRDMFLAMFFISIGMLLDLFLLEKYLFPILIILVFFIIGKIFSCTLGTFITGYDARTSLKVGFSMIAIGEFSFVVIKLGSDMNVTSEGIYQVIVIVSAITAFILPFSVKSSNAIIEHISKATPKPFKSYTFYLTKWILKLRSSFWQSTEFSKKVKELATRIAINLLIIIMIVITSQFIYNYVLDTVAWIDDIYITLTFVITTFILIFPFIYTILGSLSRFIDVATDTTVTSSPLTNIIGRRTIHKVIRDVVALIFSFIVLIALLPLVARLGMPWTFATILLLVIIVMAGFIILKSSVKEFHKRLENVFYSVLVEEKEIERISEAERAERLREEMEKGARMCHLTIHKGSELGNLKLYESKIREKGGALILAIEREGRIMINPSSDIELKEGDTLLVMGTDEQIDALSKMCEYKQEKG